MYDIQNVNVIFASSILCTMAALTTVRKEMNLCLCKEMNLCLRKEMNLCLLSLRLSLIRFQWLVNQFLNAILFDSAYKNWAIYALCSTLLFLTSDFLLEPNIRWRVIEPAVTPREPAKSGVRSPRSLGFHGDWRRYTAVTIRPVASSWGNRCLTTPATVRYLIRTRVHLVTSFHHHVMFSSCCFCLEVRSVHVLLWS